MEDEKYYRKIVWMKKRWETWLYCVDCGILIGRFHKRQNDRDFWNPTFCQCDDPIPFDIELSHVKEFHKPYLDYIDDRNYGQGLIETRDHLHGRGANTGGRP